MTEQLSRHAKMFKKRKMIIQVHATNITCKIHVKKVFKCKSLFKAHVPSTITHMSLNLVFYFSHEHGWVKGEKISMSPRNDV